MIFNPYAFIDLAGFIAAICFLITLLKTVKERKIRVLIFHTYLFGALTVLFEFILESLSLKYYNTIIFLVDMEMFSGTLSVSFIILLIIALTNTKVSKLWRILIFIPSVTILFCAIFFPGKYIITRIKLIPTGYFGVYGPVVKMLNIIYGISGFTIIIILLMRSIGKTTDILHRRRLQYIVTGISIFLFFALIFVLIQTIFKIYYLSVGGINLYIIFLGFLCFIFMNRNLSDINMVLRNKILYPVINLILIAFFVFLIFLFKNIWNIFIKDDSIILFSIFIIFTVIYLFPIYNRFITIINKILYKVPISLTESSQIFLTLLESAKNLDELRESLWKWFEENLPIETLNFWTLKKRKIVLVKRLGEKSEESGVKNLKSKLRDSRLRTLDSRLYFVIKDKEEIVEIIEIINFKNKTFTRQELKILEIILLYYEIFYININLMQKLVMKGKIKLLRKLSKNFKYILTKAKERINEIQTELKTEKKGSEELKERIIKRLNEIIVEIRVF